jgi:uncharacterized protein involved in response to NO
MPAATGALDGVALVLVPIALAVWVLGAVGWFPGLLLVAAGVASAARLARWQGLAIRRDALIAVLHIGYAWLSLGLVPLGLSQVSPGAATVTLHALLQLAILLRVAAAFLPDAHRILLGASGAAWIGSFALFALVYGRYLIQERTNRSRSR